MAPLLCYILYERPCFLENMAPGHGSQLHKHLSGRQEKQGQHAAALLIAAAGERRAERLGAVPRANHTSKSWLSMQQNHHPVMYL